MSNITPTLQSVEQVDPRTLLVDVNVRADARVDAALVDSIRDLGVLQPIVGVRTAEGTVRVRYGHRRTLAAVEAGLRTVPVLVVGDEATTDADHVDRLVGQWSENEHRVGLSVTEKAAATAQLAAFGLSPAQIARRTRTARADVTAALVVAGSPATAPLIDAHHLDLPQAAVVAEFADDPAAVDSLVRAVGTGQFPHVAQRLRDARADAKDRADTTDRLTAAGFRVVDRPNWGDPATRLDS